MDIVKEFKLWSDVKKPLEHKTVKAVLEKDTDSDLHLKITVSDGLDENYQLCFNSRFMDCMHEEQKEWFVNVLSR